MLYQLSHFRSMFAHLRADDGIRTRDPHLGKVMLYQLSHVRAAPLDPKIFAVQGRTIAHRPDCFTGIDAPRAGPAEDE